MFLSSLVVRNFGVHTKFQLFYTRNTALVIQKHMTLYYKSQDSTARITFLAKNYLKETENISS